MSTRRPELHARTVDARGFHQPVKHHPKGSEKPHYGGDEKRVGKTLYVLDTNVLIHDPGCLFKFQEHDVMLLMYVIEELDNHKKGTSDTNRSVREALRTIRSIIGKKVSANRNKNGLRVPLSHHSQGHATGMLYLQNIDTPQDEKMDNRILDAIAALQESGTWASVVLVTKDNAMFIKAGMRKIRAQDYRNDVVLEADEKLYSGIFVAPTGWMNRLKILDSRKVPDAKTRKVTRTQHVVDGGAAKGLMVNQFIDLGDHAHHDFRVISTGAFGTVLENIINRSAGHEDVYGIHAHNKGQNYALELLLNPSIHLVTIAGGAGSGKTFITLASALEQVDARIYSEIIFTRETIPLGEDIGFLPGTEEEKMEPWLGALRDNLEALQGNAVGKDGEKLSKIEKAITNDIFVRSKISTKSTAFMRGRTLFGRFLIIDECQNLTPKKVKALITRAGEGTKVVCLGNLNQIDAPYLTEGSSGFAHLIDRMKGWKGYGHVTLTSGVRSELATKANEIL